MWYSQEICIDFEMATPKNQIRSDLANMLHSISD